MDCPFSDDRLAAVESLCVCTLTMIFDFYFPCLSGLVFLAVIIRRLYSRVVKRNNVNIGFALVEYGLQRQSWGHVVRITTFGQFDQF